MHLTSRTQGKILVVECRTESLDASNVTDFREAMQHLMRQQTEVVFDMSQLMFIDSSGVGALIACLRDANARKGDFRLCSMSRQVRMLFDLMRMHKVFSLHDSADQALASFV